MWQANIFKFDNHPTVYVNAIAITPDGRQVVSGSNVSMINVWDLKSGNLLRSLEGALRINALAITPDGQKVIAGSEDTVLKIWDLESGTMLGSLNGHTGPVTSVMVTRDGRYVISGASWGWATLQKVTVKVWDLETRQCQYSLQGHTDRVNAVGITNNGQQVISGSEDKTIRLWDLPGGSSRILFWNDAPMHCLALSQDEHYFCCGDSSGRVWIFEWIASEHSSLSTKKSKHDQPIPAGKQGIVRTTQTEPAFQSKKTGSTRKSRTRPQNIAKMAAVFRYQKKILFGLFHEKTLLVAICPYCHEIFPIDIQSLGAKLHCPTCKIEIQLNPVAIDSNNWKDITEHSPRSG
ncbi:MAG TPA: WD40 repeat domain-containing protein [Leptolinea sp.]